MLEFNVSQVRELKGAPLSVIALLSISPLPVSQDWLARSSGYTDKPIHQACQYLQEQGLISNTRSGWFMPKATQAPLVIQSVAEPLQALAAPHQQSLPDDLEVLDASVDSGSEEGLDQLDGVDEEENMKGYDPDDT